MVKFFVFNNGVLNDGDYLITIPRVFTVGMTQKIGINIFGNKSCEVEIALYDSRKYDIQSKVEGHFKPSKTGVLELQVPQGLYKPKVTAKVCGVKSAKKIVTYRTPMKKIYIHPNRQAYL